jgi:multidrug resistance efflux pump
MESLLTSWQPLNVKGVITDVEYEQQRLQSATIREKIAEARKAYDAAVGLMRVADGQKTKVEGQLSEFTSQGLELPDLEQIMSPLKQAIAVQEKAIAELDWQIQTLDIKSPVTGQVVEVHVLPGQSVRAGDPIVTIAAQGGQFLESYVRQDQRVQPVVGMRVKLRARRMGSRMVESEVDRVGSQVVAVPLQHLSDPATPEWGVPVRIRVPEELGARPGELIEITYPMR